MNSCENKPHITPGCIGCGLCQSLCPDVFEVHNVSHVKPNIDYQKYAKQVAQAIKECPMEVITYEYSTTYKNERE